MTTTTEAWPNAQARDHGDREGHQLAVLTETCDYTRRIHWWVRLFGVVWLTTMALGVLIGAALGILAASTANDVSKLNDVNNNGSSSYSTRAECMNAIETTAAFCESLFPN
jgi:hypothetical protein